MSEPNFFSSGSPFLQHPLLTQQRTAEEVDFVLSQSKLTQGARILDVGCGFGRHTIELSRRGYQAVGIDPSPAMIQAAIERANEVRVQPQFFVSSGEDFSPDGKFEVAICLFTTLGQINTKENEPQTTSPHPLLKQIAENLDTKGILILEVPQKSWVVNNLKSSDRFGNESRFTDIKRSYDHRLNIVTEVFTIVNPGKTREYLLLYQLFSLNQVRNLLEETGFGSIQFFGDYQATPLKSVSPNIIAVAHKGNR